MCFSVNIVVVSLEREEGDYGSVVLTLAILAKIVSNIGWFIMWVQGIEVRARICIVNLSRSPEIDSQLACGPVQQPYLSYRPARLHRLEESNPRNRFLGSLKVYKYRLRATRYFLGLSCCNYSVCACLG